MGIKSNNVQHALLGNKAEVQPAGLLRQAGNESGLLVRINVSLIPGESLVDHRLEKSQ
jgi:hypothetical protein